MYRRGAEQGATDFAEGPNQSNNGCLLLSINPPLLKQMSGNNSSFTTLSHLLGSKNLDIINAQGQSQRMPSHGTTMESQIQTFPEQVARQAAERRSTDPQPSKGQLTSAKGQTSGASGACFSL